MKQFNYNKGRQGEQIACNFLKKKGYTIIQTNYRTRFGEIDIIASPVETPRRGVSTNNVLVFVEVKLKSGTGFGSPEEMITPSKMWQVHKTAEMFLVQERALAKEFKQYRIDAVCITLDENGNQIVKHYENVPND